jgi:hypothetical protein
MTIVVGGASAAMLLILKSFTAKAVPMGRSTFAKDTGAIHFLRP